jgi:hypothetical protein
VTTRNIVRPLTRGDTFNFQAPVYAANFALGVNSPYTAGPFPPYPGPGNTPLENLTGWSGYCTLKYDTQVPDQAAIYQATSGVVGGVSFPTPATQGVVQVVIPGSATALLADGTVTILYDIKLIDPTGNEWTVESGCIQLFANVTRAAVVPP